MTTAQFIIDKIISILLVVFTHGIPLLSSIRAVHHHDKESFQQWLTYYLLIFILNPLFDIIRAHPVFRLAVVIWLSLPKFQGALFVYNEVVDVLMERYGVEDKVDQKIEHVKSSMKDAAWRIAKDIGWSTLSQIGELVTFVQESADAYTGKVVDGAISQRQYNGSAAAKGLQMKKDQSTESLSLRKPSHSVQEGMSSFSSVESISDIAEREAYASDFTSMLKEGLFVFAAYSHLEESNESTEEATSSKRFRLRVFFYESDDESDSNANDPEPYFVLHPVENNLSIAHDQIEIISLSDVRDIRREGTNAIAFIGSSSESTPVEKVKSEPDASAPATAEDDGEMQETGIGENENVLTEIVLSTIDDRETLFQGMKFCFKEFSGQDGAGQTQIKKGVDPSETDSGNSSDESSTEISEWNNDENDIKGKHGCTEVPQTDDDDLDHPNIISEESEEKAWTAVEKDL